MKNTLLVLLGLLLFGCTSPVSVDTNNELLKTLSTTSGDAFKILNHSTTTKGIASLNYNNDAGYTFYNFDGELNFDDTKMTLINVTTDMNTEHGIFVWNAELISGNYTKTGLRRAKFAFADAQPVGIAGTVNLAKFEFEVKEPSEVCVVNFLYGQNIIISEICKTISLQSNPITFTIGGN